MPEDLPQRPSGWTKVDWKYFSGDRPGRPFRTARRDAKGIEEVPKTTSPRLRPDLVLDFYRHGRRHVRREKRRVDHPSITPVGSRNHRNVDSKKRRPLGAAGVGW